MKCFNFCKTLYLIIDCIPEEKQLNFFRAICDYALDGEEPGFEGPELGIWIGMKSIIDETKEHFG